MVDTLVGAGVYRTLSLGRAHPLPGDSSHCIPTMYGRRLNLMRRSLAGIDCGLLARFKPTASALPDAPFSDGGRAGTKPNGFEL